MLFAFLFCGVAAAATMQTTHVTTVKNTVGTTNNNQDYAKLTTITATNRLANTAWPKFNHDNKNTGQSQYDGRQTSPSLKWKYKIGSYNHASYPVIGSDGTVYFGCDNSYFYALNPNGTLKWKYKTGSIGSSPAIGSDGTLYFGCDNSYVYALNPSGTLKWKYKTNSMRMNSFSSYWG